MTRMKRILLIDNYDSFTYNLYDYFLQLNVHCDVIRNDEPFLQHHPLYNYDGIVLSPGPKSPKDAGQLMNLIKQYHQEIPLLGICLGHQGIGEFFGAKLRKANSPMHGKTSEIVHRHRSIFNGLPENFKVMRYHSLILENLDECPLEIIAQTEDAEIMAIKHQTLPICGVQFHPESILTEHGLALLENWLKTMIKPMFKIVPMPPQHIDDVIEHLSQVMEEIVGNKELKGFQHFMENVANKGKMLDRMKKGCQFFIVFHQGRLAAVTELRPPGHLALLFVGNDFQGKGLGKKLLAHAIETCISQFPEATKMTLNSNPNAVAFYEKLKLFKTDELKIKNGISYVPMAFSMKLFKEED